MSHFITRGKADEMIRLYKEMKDKIIDPLYIDRELLANCESFDRAAIEALLGQANCSRIRIHYGMDVDLKVHAIMVAVDDTDNEIIPGNPDETTEQIIENGSRCPTVCPTGTSLGG
jgi:hypothetical protein